MVLRCGLKRKIKPLQIDREPSGVDDYPPQKELNMLYGKVMYSMGV
jgi:hypothetical protein